MGWMKRRRAWRDYERGEIATETLREALGLMPEVRKRATYFYQDAAPTNAVTGDVWVNRDKGEVMGWNGLHWESFLVPTTQEAERPESPVDLGGEIKTQDSSSTLSAQDSEEEPARPEWRDTPLRESLNGDGGLAALLWGTNPNLLRKARHVAQLIERAGWVHDGGLGERALAEVLLGHDLRHFNLARDMATLIETLGWARRVPEVGFGEIGIGLAPITDDEWHVLHWCAERGIDARETLDAILAARPGSTLDGAAEMLLSLDREIRDLMALPWRTTSPHCAHEYNGGLANALRVIAERASERNITMEDVVLPPEEEPTGDGAEADPGEDGFVEIAPGVMAREVNLSLPDQKALHAMLSGILGPLLAQHGTESPDEEEGKSAD